MIFIVKLFNSVLKKQTTEILTDIKIILVIPSI